MRTIVLITFLSLSVHVFGFQLTPEFEAKIQAHLDTLVTEDDFGGVTIGMVLPDGEIVGFAAGYSDMEKRVPMKPVSRMLGGSTGKIFVSAAVMQLVEERKIKLDKKVKKYLGKYPWYDGLQNSQTITVRNLLQHASGIDRYVFQEKFQQEVTSDPDRIWNPEELLAFVNGLPPLFEAGTQFAYSDTNYIILGMIIEEVTGMSMYDYIQGNFLDPFELTNTSPQVGRQFEGLASGYSADNDPFYPGKVSENGNYKYNVQFEWAGGGFVTNTMDLAWAAKLIYEGQVFDEKLLTEFFKGIDAGQLGGQWGLGVHMRGRSYGHSGYFPGYITNINYYPESGLCIAVQVNTSDPGKLGIYRKVGSIEKVVMGVIGDE